MEKIEKKMRKKKSFHSEIGLIDLFHIVLCSLNAVKNFLTLSESFESSNGKNYFFSVRSQYRVFFEAFCFTFYDYPSNTG